MQQNDALEKSKETKDAFLLPLIIITFLACALLVYAYMNRAWLPAVNDIAAWWLHPTINWTSVPVIGVPWAFLASIEVLFLGFTSTYLLLGRETDRSIKIITGLGLGFGLTGLITIILGIFGSLYQAPLNAAILLVGSVSLLAVVYRKKTRENLSLKDCFTPHFNFKFKLPPNLKFWLPACIAIAVIYFFCFYHAILTVIVHWDATVYHAVMSVIMYNNHGIPVIAGPSIGIEMSANFPPMFSSLGAYYYVQVGAIEDVFLRAIPPVMGILTVFATYKIGEILAGKKYGLIAALFLAITPLFFRYSIYATSYSTLTFFCTVSILFLLLAIVKGDTKYWVTSGIFFGFATLTSYIALYLAPFLLIALLGYLILRKNAFKVNLKKAVILLGAVFAIGGVWYLRNLIVVGNPIYPNAYTVLGGINIDPLIMETTNTGIKYSANLSFFGGDIPLFEKIMMFLTYRTHFPSFSLLTLLGFAFLPTQNKKFWLLAIWPLSLTALILSGISWGFPRHMVFAMPGFALLSALPILKLLEIIKKNDAARIKVAWPKIGFRLPSIRQSDVIRVSLVVVLFVAFLFPGLTLSMAGKIHSEVQDGIPPEDYLFFLENPNSDKWIVLNKLYSEAIAWQYMNDNLNPGEKVASIENRIYYVKNCSNEYFFYLDGWEARELYNITDPVKMVQFLRNENVTIIVDVAWARLHGHFDILPLAKYLGSPYFPTLVDLGLNPNIYRVGPIDSPVTNNSTFLVSTSQLGWSEVQSINGVRCQSVLAGNNSARLFVSTPNATSIRITYLNNGNHSLGINMRTADNRWIYDYASIQTNNTGKWVTYEFSTPKGDGKFMELGLHAFNGNFTISKIEAYLAAGKPLK